ncbi:hypothetical protein [Halorussus lipolyticus]|uniref:hypothetical protein n=1 Tax=Halorussus lipolyticus TaxID=3034024 RepID=UPI0023E88036|nr:hypothetical protein [Halorussus sp. DT80]
MVPVSRRGLLATIAVGVAGRAAARTTDATEYVIEQGDQCIPVTPLSGEESAESFYDYRTPNTSPSGATYSSYGTRGLQRAETSICFLYDGPEGLSLVVVHDKLRDGTPGGAVTFDLNLANPDRGSWLVGDDDYDAPTNYDTFARTDTGWRVDWTWAEARSDGGVYGLLGEDFALTIDPSFNRQAALYDDHYEGELTDWQFLTGDRTDPERISLAMDRPVTIRPGGCGERTTTSTTTTRRETTEETTRDDESEKRPSEPLEADVEIFPGKVNPRSHGRLPVVVRSSEEFDATALAPGTVAFGPGDAEPGKRIRTDADDDGREDLKLLFWMDATGIGWETDEVRLTGETESGREVVGEAEVRLAPNRGEDDESDADDENGERNESGERNENDEDDESEDEADRDEAGNGEADEDEAEDGDDGEDERGDEEPEREGDDDAESGDDEDHPGRGHGNGKNRGEGRGRGRGNGRGKGRGKGRGNDKGRGKGD